MVFRGEVLSGEIGLGQAVSVPGGARRHLAKVVAIELNRNLLEKSQPGVELGLLLDDFNHSEVRHFLALANLPDDDSELPTPEALLGIELPVEIVDAT
jgi:translation elongation factor EF-Tu-like GTPase